MPIDSTEDVEVVETQIESGTETGDQVEGAMVDVDPDLTKGEMALSNMMKEDDGGWDDAEGGGEGVEGSSFGDALQGEDETTDNGGNPEENPPDDSSEGGDTSTGDFKPDTSSAPEALRTMGRGSGGVKDDSENNGNGPKDKTDSNSHLYSLKEADYNKRLSDKNEWLFEGKENGKKMDEIENELEKCNDEPNSENNESNSENNAVRVVLKNELAQRKAYQRIINDNIQNTHC